MFTKRYMGNMSISLWTYVHKWKLYNHICAFSYLFIKTFIIKINKIINLIITEGTTGTTGFFTTMKKRCWTLYLDQKSLLELYLCTLSIFFLKVVPPILKLCTIKNFVQAYRFSCRSYDKLGDQHPTVGL